MSYQWEFAGKLMLRSICEDVKTAKAELLNGARRSPLEYIEGGEMIYTEALVHLDELVADLGRPSDPELAGFVDLFRRQTLENLEYLQSQHRQLAHEMI